MSHLVLRVRPVVVQVVVVVLLLQLVVVKLSSSDTVIDLFVRCMSTSLLHWHLLKDFPLPLRHSVKHYLKSFNIDLKAVGQVHLERLKHGHLSFA